jgi:hypothetical protein
MTRFMIQVGRHIIPVSNLCVTLKFSRVPAVAVLGGSDKVTARRSGSHACMLNDSIVVANY